MDAQELYNGCMNNSETAWRYAYNYVLTHLKKKVYRSDQVILEDITQKTLQFLIRRYFTSNAPGKVINPKGFKNILRTTAVRNYITYLRSAGRKNKHVLFELKSQEGKTYYDNPQLPAAGFEPEERLIFKEMVSILFGIIRKLDTPCDHLLKTYYKGKLTGIQIQEMARENGFVPNNFSVKVSRCIKQLKKYPEFSELMKEFNQM